MEQRAQRIGRLYMQGASARELAARFGVGERTVVRYGKATGIPRRGRYARLPRPICEHSDCSNKVRKPRARFCSRACTRIHPRPAPQACEHCGVIFTPPAYRPARFHSCDCWTAFTTGRPLRAWRAEA